jgi:hypothetical protein
MHERTNLILPIAISSLSIKPDNQIEYTVFDAVRDNKGVGLKSLYLLRILKKINK